MTIKTDKLVLIESTNGMDVDAILGNGCIIVEEGTEYSVNQERTHFTIRLENDKDYSNVLREIEEKQYELKSCIHMISGEQRQAKVESGFLSIFRLVKALMNGTQTEKIKLIYVFEGKHPEYIAVAGFLKTLVNESTDFTACTVQLDHFGQLKEIPEFKNEVLEYDGDKAKEFCFTGGKKKVRKMVDLFGKEQSKQVSIEPDGVYLITGGAGGLGLIFAKHIAMQKPKAVILAGRSKLTNEKKAQLEELSSQGCSVVYMQADISEQQSVKQTIQNIKNKFGQITGIIHAAGVIRDNFIMRQTIEELAEVLKPKVHGTCYLDEQLEEEQLDFFVTFSSLTSVLGTVGQGAYAYANSFMNAFVENRRLLVKKGLRKGKSISINWPLWNGVGMQVDQKSKDRFVEKLGILPLEIEEGLKAFDDALAQEDGQIFVVTGDKEKEDRAFGIKESNRSLEFQKKDYGSKVLEHDEEKLEEAAAVMLKEILSEQIGLAVDKIKEKQSLDKYGIDSVMILDMTDILESKFGKLSKTLFFEYKTIEQLSKYFAKKFGDKLREQMEPSEESMPESRLEQGMNGEPVQVQTFHLDEKDVGGLEQKEEEIAIIGLAGRYPGAQNIEEFWDNLRNGRDCITEIPADRWEKEKYATNKKEAGVKKIYSKWGGFLKDIDCFDNKFFSISGRDAQNMDPQERLFLENVWETIEDAGYTKEKLNGERVGVYVGVMYGHYQLFGAEEIEKGNYVIPNSTFASIANRVSYFFDFDGPSIALDTMCSSSLTALHLAAASLKNGEADYAIAGGVNLTIHPYKYVQLCQGQFLSEDGRCRSFGEGGTGYVPGEGVGSVLLKPLSKAKRDGDYIYGIIKGSAMNHGGKTNGYTVPNPAAQSSLIQTALKHAEVLPQEVSYLEAHGTGTSLGDPIEITGLNQAFDVENNKNIHCYIGSVKSCIGHLESAAGIAAVTKVLLQMKHKKIVPSLHAEVLNQNIDFADTPFIVQRELRDWDVKGKRIAGISTFGAGGSNVHVILEEYKNEKPEYIETRRELIVLSAKNPEQLQLYLQKYIQYLDTTPKMPLSLLARNLQTTREVMEDRIAIVAIDKNDLKDKLIQYVTTSELPENCYHKYEKERDCEISEEATKLYEMGDYEAVAKMWVNGLQPDWDAVYEGVTIHKVSLPTHPFLKKHFWVQKSENKILGNYEIGELVDGIVQKASMGEGLCYSKTLNANDWILRDHVVKENCVLPGAAYIEMAYEVLNHIAEKEQYSIKEIFWSKACTVEEEKTIHIKINQIESGFSVKFLSSEEDTKYAECYIEKKENHDFHEDVSLQTMKANALEKKQSETVYESFGKNGIYYGEKFHIVEELYLGETEALSKLHIGDEYNENREKFILHPLLIDGALQTLSGIRSISQELFLPYSIGAVIRIHPVSKNMYAHAHKNSDNTFDIDLLDETGRVCVQLQSVIVRRHKSKKDSDKEMYFVPGWERFEDAELQGVTTGKHPVIVYSEESETFVKQFERELHGVARKLVITKEYKQSIGNTEYIHYENVADIQKVLETQNNMDSVYAVFGFDSAEQQPMNVSGMVMAELYSKILFYTLKEAVNRNEIRIHIVTNQMYKVNRGEKINPDAAVTFAFAKSVSKEYQQADIHCIDLEWNKDLQEEDVKKQLAFMQTNCEEIAVRDFVCYKRVMYPVKLAISQQKVAFRKEGVYIIIGGNGGIGYELAKYLAKRYQAAIVLAGRRLMNKEIQDKLNEIEALGGKATYLSADITSEQEVKELVEKAESVFGAIHGVIHSALVLEDRLFRNMDELTMIKVLNPKVKGLMNLYAALKYRKLDFLLLFSSVNAYSCSLGQANYAGASMFEDTYAEYINDCVPFQVKTLNWGYWGSVGIVSDEKYRARMEKQGVYSIEIEEGIEAIEKLLQSALPHMVYLKADKEIMDEIHVNSACVMEEYTKDTVRQTTADFAKQWNQYKQEEVSNRIFGNYNQIEEYSRLLLMKFFYENGLYELLKNGVTQKEIELKLQTIAKYSRLTEAMLILLKRDGWITVRNGIFSIEVNWPDCNTMEERLQEIRENQTDTKAYQALVDTCVNSLTEVVSGRVDYTNIMFPNNSMHLVENIYRNNFQADYFNKIVAKNIAEEVKERVASDSGAKITILEIGSGTGGTSKFVLNELSKYGKNITYIYTDVSVSFLNYGRKEFGTAYEFMEFKLLNIEKEIQEQLFESDSIDIVFASNVLHATEDMSLTLSHIKELLKKDGMVVINEAAELQYFTTLTFGLADGWWYYKDEAVRTKGAPVLSLGKWENLLVRFGFFDVMHYHYENEKGEIPQLVMTAYSDGIITKRIANKKEETKVKAPSQPVKKKSVQGDMKGKITEYLIDVFAGILRSDKEDIDAEEEFEALGVDSLIVMEVMKELEKDFGKLDGALLFKYETIQQLCDYFIESQEEKLKELFSDAQLEGVAEDIAIEVPCEQNEEEFVDKLSENEIDMLIDMISKLS